ncbi:alternative oxidase 1, mitochondrial precursor [Candida tropicalis MYA-3404]|uniref:Alternative oxidase n=1 Tax=Candida tropicalis (strain ATCC MYA-3404 / T1) TaxID=294747 RepID=C5MB29_CANTT|nr:alternative oxidase 1, mitochondrial precursor [Candida tropicalis MYA-3404]EER32846.1 alternative oxidase 1, mitochondrial precursor [Candida tropicalis MYA-3404]KAG4406673.1 hypothetical protein JTP64_004057 [Candida tropicalis]MCP8716230.1 alternative oxidase [Asgard group archaeon]
MLSTTVYRKLPVVSTTTCHNLIRLSSTLTAPPSTPLNQVPKHSSNHEDSSIFVEPKKSAFDVSTKIYSQEGVNRNDDSRYLTKPTYPHPVFPTEECENVTVTHREPRTFGDKLSYKGIHYVRKIFDFFTGYADPSPSNPNQYVGTRYEMTEGKWMTRCIFLESVAGVPGSVAGFIRHLHSLRMLKRDKAWIETLHDEAYNERMHLLTFIKIGKPSWFTRSIIYVGQGVFTNVFFFLYLLNPRYCHRFVGYLEEEAVRTYTHLLEELKEPGKLPNFQKMKIPTVAAQYWPELTNESSFRDLILRIRADEAKHREVNHTFANLEQKSDRNPFALKIEGLNEPQPNHGLKVMTPTGWERKDMHL